MSEILCIYHGNCADGFGAAWAVWKKFPDAAFHAGVYGAEPPDTKGKRVILVDFSYKPDVLKRMAKQAKSMLILDHHKSSIEEIKAFKNIEGGMECQLFVHMADTYKNPLSWERHVGDAYQDESENIPTAIIYTLFDMERSGAMIAYEFFHPGKPVPPAIGHIQDRDLWRFKLPNTREFQAALFSYPYEFEVWDKLILGSTQPLIDEGKAIERKHFKDIEELIKVSARKMYIGGHRVWVANLPYTLASDACHSMCKWPMYPDDSGEVGECLTPFAACYYDKPEGRVFSLRSIGEFDVAKIAQAFGGGGHKNAAGFSVPLGWEGDDQAT